MSKFLLFFFSFFIFSTVCSAKDSYSKLFGQWKGVKMFQDENSYDGSTFFLPNEGEMILNEKSIHIYYYPYFKSAEFAVKYTDESILYTINDKEIKCNYSFKGDTLTFRMEYINKIFVKLFTKVELDERVIFDLDQFGFRTQKLEHEFELDTLHQEQRKGFSSYDSLGFTPFQFMEFKDDNTLIIDRKDQVNFSRSYKKINFSYKGLRNELEVVHVSGTQDIYLKPITQCTCDTITIPYMSVNWANRIRQAIIDEENF
ncbi:MAG: hypothetical protein GQ574_13065 [Crocinitomix sp.]|nr:hypothetical protein [Crocinitomix sp.]